MSTTTIFFTGPESVEAARFVNEAFATGKVVTVNGVEVWSRFGSPASSWGNGSFSWKSRAASRLAAERTNWVKSGNAVRVVVLES